MKQNSVIKLFTVNSFIPVDIKAIRTETRMLTQILIRVSILWCFGKRNQLCGTYRSLHRSAEVRLPGIAKRRLLFEGRCRWRYCFIVTVATAAWQSPQLAIPLRSVEDTAEEVRLTTIEHCHDSCRSARWNTLCTPIRRTSAGTASPLPIIRQGDNIHYVILCRPTSVQPKPPCDEWSESVYLAVGVIAIHHATKRYTGHDCSAPAQYRFRTFNTEQNLTVPWLSLGTCIEISNAIRRVVYAAAETRSVSTIHD